MNAKRNAAIVGLLLIGFGAVSVTQAGEAETLVAQARAAAQIDKNEESARLFSRALELDPQLRGAILREFADQLLYSGEPERAIRLFNEVIASAELSPPDEKRVRRSRALAYLWSGAFEDAIGAYQALVDADPEDGDARENLSNAYVGAAREAARVDRNEMSAEWFAAAIEATPERRGELLHEYADQLTYSGHADEAINLYREMLSGEILSGALSADTLSDYGLALLWSGRHRSAMSTYEQVLAMRADDRGAMRDLADAIVALAREHAVADRNAEAAELFEQALARTPVPRSDWVKEYADQLTYSQRTEEAIKLYESLLDNPVVTKAAKNEIMLSLALARSWSGALTEALSDYEQVLAEDAGNLQARVGKAEVLSWMERHDAAADELRHALDVDPGNDDTRRRLARSESYRGRQRVAIEIAMPLVEADPSDADAAIIVAEAQRWMGRPDLAVETLDRLLAQRPDHAKARDLRDDLLRERRPRTSAGVSHSTQSDDLDVTSVGVRQTFTLNGGRTILGPQYRHIEFRRGNGSGVGVERIGGFIVHRFNDTFEAGSSVFLDFQNGSSDDTIFTHASSLTIFPNDLWRIDLGARRFTLDNLASLNQGIAVDSYGGSVDFWPTGDTKISGRGNWSDYSDGNERWWVQGEIRQRLLRGPDLWVGVRQTNFGFARLLNNGYFNPNDLSSTEGTLQLSGTLFGDTYFDASASAGYEDADPGDGKFIWALGLELRHPLTESVDLEAQVGHTSSTLGSDSGFSRTNFGLGMSVRW